MLIVKFQGGLGNQMFQYAFYKCLSQNNEVYVDLSWFNSHDSSVNRPYILKYAFGIDVIEAREKVLARFKVPFLFRVVNKFILNRTDYKISKSEDNLYVEYPYVSQFFYLSRKNGYLDGYWQSEIYFDEIKELIKKDFTFNVDNQRVKQIADEIKSTRNSVSLHWRRGDYVGNPIHDILTPNYFYKSLNTLIDLKAIKKVFVFTEDFSWVENKLRDFNLNLDFKIISKELTEIEDYYEMYLMSICNNNIISNSSFSWWGAYLNNNIDKIVLAPSNWYGDEDLEYFSSDLILKEWIKVLVV